MFDQDDGASSTEIVSFHDETAEDTVIVSDLSAGITESSPAEYPMMDGSLIEQRRPFEGVDDGVMDMVAPPHTEEHSIHPSHEEADPETAALRHTTSASLDPIELTEATAGHTGKRGPVAVGEAAAMQLETTGAAAAPTLAPAPVAKSVWVEEEQQQQQQQEQEQSVQQPPAWSTLAAAFKATLHLAERNFPTSSSCESIDEYLDRVSACSEAEVQRMWDRMIQRHHEFCTRGIF